MKKYLLGVFAIALAIGFSAFTSNHGTKQSNNLFTYYAFTTDGINFDWTTTNLSLDQNYSCTSVLSARCTSVQASSKPAVNTIPSGYSSEGTVYEYIGGK